MRILISSLLLLGGLNLVLARSIYWNDHDSMANKWLSNYNYDDELFQYPSNRYNDDIHKLMMGESLEESKETPLYPAIDDDIIPRDEDVNIANIFSSLFDTFHEIDSTKMEKSEEDTNNNEEISNNENDNEDDQNDDEENNQFEIFLHVPSDNMETDLEVSKSSEEKKDDEKENSDEVPTSASNVVVELIDLTKSSEEKEEVNEADDLSKQEIEELAALIITLTAIDDLMKITDENPDYADNEQDDELKTKEVDEYLNLFSSLLDKMLEDEQNTTGNDENNDDDVTTPTNDSDEEDNDYTTPKTDSNEDDDTDDDYTTPKTDDSNEDDDTDDDFTTPKKDSNEDDDTDDDYTTPKTDDSNEDDDTNTSNSKENEIEDISFVFHGIDDEHHESNLNDHKYEIVETPASDSSYMNVIRSSSSSQLDNQIVIQEYVDIRQDLDIEQDVLQMNKLNLDKDFYNIISDDFHEDNINKFEKDLFVVHENLDRIKRNVNAMQHLNSKLYFHKLIKDTLKEVQHK
ncbi:coiled-coil domain-containing protein 1-like [Calliphora vicina]|uniref:coiled-coil domain-containing protein 1-like n=1 Tax=Calliphora vicina TaxID=7373 RepID=UPI00325BCC38